MGSVKTFQTSKVWRRILFSILYAVVVSVASAMLLKLAREELEGGGGGGTAMWGGKNPHDAAIRALVVRPSGETLDDIGGLAQVKEDWRRAVLLPLQRPEIFYRGPKALRPPKGILLHGPPGTGKPMLARAIASESGVPFVALTSAALESKWWGESSKLIEAAFRVARKDLAPCVLFFDELDGLGRSRSESDQSCVYAFKTELLRNLDGVEGDTGSPVVVLACTNCPHSLDPALRRRFPRLVHIDRPDKVARLDILQKLVREELVPPDPTVLDVVAEAAEGTTGSDLAALFADASAARFNTSVEKMLPSVTDGHELLHQLGPLGLEHWGAAAMGRGMRMHPTPATSEVPEPSPIVEEEEEPPSGDASLSRT